MNLNDQTKLESAYEGVLNIVLGILLALISYQIIMPLLGHHITFNDNLFITGYFTVLGFCRHYVIRRYFNALLRRKM